MDTVHCDGVLSAGEQSRWPHCSPIWEAEREILVFSLISPFTSPQDHGVLNASSNRMWSHLS